MGDRYVKTQIGGVEDAVRQRQQQQQQSLGAVESQPVNVVMPGCGTEGQADTSVSTAGVTSKPAPSASEKNLDTATVINTNNTPNSISSSSPTPSGAGRGGTATTAPSTASPNSAERLGLSFDLGEHSSARQPAGQAFGAGLPFDPNENKASPTVAGGVGDVGGRGEEGSEAGVASPQPEGVPAGSQRPQVLEQRLSPAEQSREVWMGQVATRNGGGVVELQQTGGGRGEVDAGSATRGIEVATGKLRLADDDDDVGDDGARGGVGNVGIEEDSPQGGGQNWQDEDMREEREREPQPKFGLKVLVPGITAGCLIGKGGRIINQLQTTTGTRVKLSQKNEFFPGTHDRVALVQGEQPAMVAEAVAEMLRRLREAGRQHPHAPPPVSMGGGYHGHEGFNMGGGGLGGGEVDGGMPGRNSQVMVRLLVPLAAGGLIIGKGGETIKAIAAKTGARVILAGKDADVAGVPSERLCSIHGDLEGAIKVVVMIVGKMAEDRGLSKYQTNQTCYQTGLTAPPPPPLALGGSGMGNPEPVQQQQQQQQQHLNSNSPNMHHLSSNNPPGQGGGGGGGGGMAGMPPPPHWSRPNRPVSAGDMGAFQGTMPGNPGGGVSAGQQGGMAGGGAVRHQMGPGTPWAGVNESENGAPPATGQAQVMGTTPSPMVGGGGGGGGGGGAGGTGGVSPGFGIAGAVTRASGAGGGAAGMGVQQQPQPQQQQQQQQQQQALAPAGHLPGMISGGMVYGYPYAVSAIPQQRPYGDTYVQGNVAGMPSMYPYSTEIPLVPTSHQGPPPDMLLEGGDVLAQTQVTVPDHMVGVILGKGGATVIDMQNITGARIQVSQRGEYVPGTHNRPVTISGTQQAVANAQMMVHNVCTQAAQYDFRQVQGVHQQQQPPFY